MNDWPRGNGQGGQRKNKNKTKEQDWLRGAGEVEAHGTDDLSNASDRSRLPACLRGRTNLAKRGWIVVVDRLVLAEP